MWNYQMFYLKCYQLLLSLLPYVQEARYLELTKELMGDDLHLHHRITKRFGSAGLFFSHVQGFTFCLVVVSG